MIENDCILNYFRILKKDTGLMLDVGAHQGQSAKPFVDRGWKVYCFEPEPENYIELTKNMEKYKYVSCIQSAVSDKDEEEMDFYVSDEYWGIHSLKPFHETHSNKVKVRSTRLDTFITKEKIDWIDLLKIDVEGFDLMVLRSMDFKKFQPSLVMTEFMDSRTKDSLGYTHHDMVSYMKNQGYDCIVFEYGPIKEHSKKGNEMDPLEFKGAYSYDGKSSPEWGNLLFYITGDNSIHQAMEKALSRKGLGLGWLPLPIRNILRPVKNHLDILIERQ